MARPHRKGTSSGRSPCHRPHWGGARCPYGTVARNLFRSKQITASKKKFSGTLSYVYLIFSPSQQSLWRTNEVGLTWNDAVARTSPQLSGGLIKFTILG